MEIGSVPEVGIGGSSTFRPGKPLSCGAEQALPRTRFHETDGVGCMLSS